MTKLSPQTIEQSLIDITTQLIAESGEPYKRQITLSISLQKIGIDSLARAELFQRISKIFNVNLPDSLLAEADTLQDIANYLQHANPRLAENYHPERIIPTQAGPIIDVSEAKTLIEVLLLYAQQAANKPHIYFQQEDGSEQIITYSQLLTASLQLAAGLQAQGLNEGDTVAIMQPTHPNFFYCFFGTLLAGGIPVPIYPPFRMHMLEAYAKMEARILSNAQVRMLITFTEAEKLSRLLKTFVPSLKWVGTADTLLKNAPLKNIHETKPDNFAFIQYTSGSTNDPKGVLLTHANLLTNIRAYGKAIQVKPTDVTVSWLPLYHDMGLIGMWLGSMCFGIPLVLLTPFSFLNHPERWLWAIHYHRGSLSGAPNFAYELCVRKLDPVLLEGLDLSSWRIAANGAEKIYPRTLVQFAEKFAPYGLQKTTLFPVYGLAESTVALTLPPLDREFKVDYVDRKKFEEQRQAVPIAKTKNALGFVACGAPLEGHEVRIVDDQNQVLPDRHIGNLQFRGPSSMQGYFNNPHATQAVMHDGWIDSGDLAYQAENDLYITGRRKDLIIKAGRNIYPAEIEEVVASINGIRQGCVIAFGIGDHDRGTEQLVVVAETKEQNKAAHNKIRNEIIEKISAELDIVPDHIELVPPHSVPKTSSGKLQRSAGKKLYTEGRLSKRRSPAWMQVGRLSLKSSLNIFQKVFATLGKLLFSLYALCVLLISFLPIYLVIRFASQPTAAKAMYYWAKFLHITFLCPIKVVGRENLTAHHPMIYVSNHASYVDVIVLLTIVPTDTVFIGKKELLSVPIIRTFMQKLKYLAVDRLDFSKGLEDTQLIEKTIQAGKSIVIFPEGTFGYAAGLRPFRLGAFKIAVNTHTPICPIALQGTRQVLRDDEFLVRPNKVLVSVSPPLMAKGIEWQDVTQLRHQVRAEIAKNCGEPSLDFIAAETVAPKIPKH